MNTPSILLWCSLKLFDLSSTEIALSSGGYELNPLMRTRTSRMLVGTTSCLATAWVDKKLDKKYRRYLRIFGILGTSFVVANNLRHKR